MKANVLKVVSLFMIMFFTLSYGKENTDEVRKYKKIENILEEMRALSDEKDRVAYFHIEYNNGIYELTNIRFIEEKEISDFTKGGVSANINSDPSGVIKIYSEFDKNDTYFEVNENQYESVERFVTNYINDDRCQNFCIVQLMIVP